MKNKTLFVFVLVAVLGCGTGSDDDDTEASGSGIDSDTYDMLRLEKGEACNLLWLEMAIARTLCTQGLDMYSDSAEVSEKIYELTNTLLHDDEFILGRNTICNACYIPSSDLYALPFCKAHLPKKFITGDTETCLLATPQKFEFDDYCREDIAQFIDCNNIEECCLSAWFVE